MRGESEQINRSHTVYERRVWRERAIEQRQIEKVQKKSKTINQQGADNEMRRSARREKAARYVLGSIHLQLLSGDSGNVQVTDCAVSASA